MKKKTEGSDEMRDHYDFSKGVRGKYVDRFKPPSNIVVLDPDVAQSSARRNPSIPRSVRT